MKLPEIKICVVGLGYVGLPLAIEFAKTKKVSVTGYINNQAKIDQLKAGIDPTNEVGNAAVKSASIEYTSDPAAIKAANFIIIAVPTPVDEDKKPDLSLIKNATETVGQNLSAGSIVVYESTVYPGVTEEFCLPILERESGLTAGKDFKIGYSPERINPGDKQHSIDKVVKVVSGQDAESLESITEVYSLICKGGVHQAPTIKVAEASKIVENIQRDLNIALMNELSLVFDRMEIDTQDVIDAAATKWNFHAYHPGLVGGHCIGIDPYYFLVQAKEKFDYEPQMILASRYINESMAEFVAKKVVADVKTVQGARVLVMGLTFKEDINDTRNSKAKDVIDHLKKAGVEVLATDPMVTDDVVEQIFSVKNSAWHDINNLDGIIYLVAHKKFSGLTLADLKKKCKPSPVLFDGRRVYSKIEAEKLGFKYLSF